MYYILLLSQMSNLQFCSESNYAAIFQLNSLPGKILFLSFRLGFFFGGGGGGGNCEKSRIFWIGNGAYGDREKRPCYSYLGQIFVISRFTGKEFRFRVRGMKKRKKSTENDQLTGHFQSFFFQSFFF